jgi:DNA-binding NarL/FixJ family response regulator
MMNRRNYRKRPLTDREKAVVQGIARGLTNAQIARELNISATAVEGRVNSIYDKLLLGSDVTREQLPECVRQ